MKKTIVLLFSMLVLTGSLAYAAYINDVFELPYPAVEERVESEQLQSEESTTEQTDIEQAGTEQTDDYAVEEQTVQIEDDGQAIEVTGSTEVIKEFTEEDRLLLEQKQKNSYAYNQLTAEEQKIYTEILWALEEFQENVKLSSMDKDEICRIFQCVLNDHPEIFYVDGYTYTQYTLGDVLKKITFTGTYSIAREEVEARKQQIDNYVNQCFAKMPQNADEYTKVKYIYEYLIDHTEHDATVEDNQNICSVFLDGKSVCQGYAKATQYLLEQAGIISTLVLGTVENGEGHAWNLVQIDGAWYYVDTTWGDASYQAVGGEASYPENKIPTINYDYLCVTTEQLCKTHAIDNVVELPACVSMDANYYVREGLYFTSVNEEQLTRIFENGYEKGNAFVTLKCASLDIYKQLQEMLITNQAIFRYLNCPDGVVSYTDDEKQFSMSFWL